MQITILSAVLYLFPIFGASDILQKSLQLYELCLCLMESKNTSIIMQSLETLQQLLKTPSNIFKQMITSPQGKQVSLFFSLVSNGDI